MIGNGNVTSLSATINGVSDFQNTYTYDNLDQMTKVVQSSNGGNAVAYKEVDYTYNADGQFTTVTSYAGADETQLVAEGVYQGMQRRGLSWSSDP